MHETAGRDQMWRPKKITPRLICGSLSTGSDAVVHAFTSCVSPTGHCARDISHQSVDAGPDHSYFSEESQQLQSEMLQWIGSSAAAHHPASISSPLL